MCRSSNHLKNPARPQRSFSLQVTVPSDVNVSVWSTSVAGADTQFYTKLTDVWAQAEQLWEGVFSIIAAILIFIMGIAFLKMDRSRVKWRYKLAKAFDKVSSKKDLTEGQVASAQSSIHKGEEAEAEREGRRGKWALFLLPFVTVLREGLEAVVFVGGVSRSVVSLSRIRVSTR